MKKNKAEEEMPARTTRAGVKQQKHRGGPLYPLLFALAYACSLLPMRLLYRIAGLLHLLLFRLLAYRKLVVIQNLSRAFPDKRYDEIATIARAFYRSLCDKIVEGLKYLSMPAHRQKEKLDLVGSDIIHGHLLRGKHVIASMGHCGNWEILSILPHILRANVNTVYKPIATKSINRLSLASRTRFGMNMIPHKAVVRHFIEHRKEPSVYLFLADQCPKVATDTYRFDFLNQKTTVFPGIEKLARMTGAGVIYLHMSKSARGRYRIECKEICDDPTATNETEITRRYLHLLQQNIEESPADWLWTHKRWKR
jgi:KDO2-lipid IV(A) lauroyltransferase